MNELGPLLSELGGPAAVAVICLYYLRAVVSDILDSNEKIHDRHASALDKLSDRMGD